MVLEDGQLRDEAIMIKGNPRQRGKVVPRQFLRFYPAKIGNLSRSVLDVSNSLKPLPLMTIR